ncbi:hypothetical protein [Desulfopila inferna]|uniref:hypothetical protein n=1 Tax=Desulfopila inferna TaxID=468528 RepID=UPI001962C389|nr:hypothetical protein [Desulfopila inferna]MBM9603110.1 hypothetical protein [Desulfopila inferna]
MSAKVDSVGRGLDGYVNSKASWRLKKTGQVLGMFNCWSCKKLAIEVDEKYYDVLFPEIKSSPHYRQKGAIGWDASDMAGKVTPSTSCTADRIARY